MRLVISLLSSKCLPASALAVARSERSILGPGSWLGLALIGLALPGCGDYASPVVDFSPEAEQSAPPSGERADGDASAAEVSATERSRSLLPVRECNLERIDGRLFSATPIDVTKSDAIILSGWIASAETQDVPPEVSIRLVSITDNRAWSVSGKTGDSREDVRTLLGGDAAYAGAGFSVVLDPASMPADTYRLFAVFSAGGSLKSCDNGRSIRILG